MAVTRNLRDGVVKFQDGAGTPEEITLVLEDGGLSWEEKQNVINILDRGILDHQRKGDEEPVTGSIKFKFIQFIKQSSESDPTPYEVVTNTGAASSWTTTNSDGADVFNFRMILEIPSPISGEQAERITFEKVAVTSLSFEEGDEYNTLSFDFQDFETRPTIVKYTP